MRIDWPRAVERPSFATPPRLISNTQLARERDYNEKGV